MPRYVALLRGVSPMNAKMAALKRCFEDTGFRNVKTVLSSGNVAFDARKQSAPALARRIETAMAATLPRSFPTLVRPAATLQAMLDSDPFAAFRFPQGAKRVVTFLRKAPAKSLALPISENGVRILAMDGLQVFTAYVPQPGNPVFMAMLGRFFGAEITTRTWETVKKCAAS